MYAKRPDGHAEGLPEGVREKIEPLSDMHTHP